MMCRNWNLQRRPRGWQLRMEGSLLNLVAPWWECRWELGTGPTLGHPAGRRRVRKMTKLLWNYWRPVRPCSAIAAPTCCGWNLKNRGKEISFDYTQNFASLDPAHNESKGYLYHSSLNRSVAKCAADETTRAWPVLMRKHDWRRRELYSVSN